MSLLRRAGISLAVVALGLLILAGSLIRPDQPVSELLPKYTNVHSQFLEIDGMSVHVRDQGPSDAPAVLLLHGTFSSLHTWEGWVDALADRYRVITLDLPGFGLTGPQPDQDYSLQATLFLLESIRSQLSIDRWAVAGNSLGAGYALAYAQHMPDKVWAVGLLNGGRIRFSEAEYQARQQQISQAQTSGQGSSWVRRALNEPLLRALMTQVSPQLLIRYALEDVYANPDKVTDLQVQRYQDLLRRQGNREAFLDRFAANRPIRDQLPPLTEPMPAHQMTIPIMIVWGERDTWIDVERGIDLAAALPSSTLTLYPELGHVPMEEDPATTAQDFLAFLDAHRPIMVSGR